MTEYLKFVKHILIVGSLDVLKILETLLFLPVITKVLGAADYGVWSQIKITMSLVVPFTFLGLHESLSRFLPGAKNKRDVQEGIYSSSFVVLLISLFFSTVFIVFSRPIAHFFGFQAVFVKFLSLLIIFESLNTTLFTAVRALREIANYFWFMVFRMIGETLLVIAVIFLGYGLTGAVVAFLMIRVVMFFVLLIYIVSKVSFKIPDFSKIKDYLHFGLPTMIDHVSYWIITSVDRYFIGFMLGILFVGYYATAYSIGTTLNIFLFPLAFMLSIVLPKFFDENNLEEVKKYLSFSLQYFLLMVIPITCGVSVLSYQLLLIFSTQEIASKAFLVVPFVALSILCYGITYFFSEILLLYKKTKIIALVWFLGAATNFGLNVFLIPLWGMLGAAFTTLVAYFAAMILMKVFAEQRLRFFIDVGFIVKSVIASITMSLVILLINPAGLFSVIIAIVFGAAIYGCMMFLLRALGKKEVIFLKSLVTTLHKI